MDISKQVQGEPGTGVWGRLASAAACLFAVLMITPFAPYMPFPGLDGSWSYAMNVATAEHLRFGKDIVFTFGPLASVYTRIYHPATDWMMLAGSLLVAVALFAALAALVPPRRKVALLLFPVVISLAWGRDAVFMLVPVLMPFVVHRGLERGSPFTATLCLLAAASAILPLVKGNFGVLLGLGTLVSLVMCWRKSRRTVILIILVEIASMVVAWMASGQRLFDLPGYFFSQAPIISGYTDAMSVAGSRRDIAVFVLLAPLLLAFSLWQPIRRHWHAPVMVVAYLFIAFKSGFVRHDEHAFVTAAALAYVGLLICLTRPTRWGVAAFLVGLLGWGVITRTYAPVTWDSAVARFAEMVRSPIRGVWQRVAQPETLPVQYAAVTAALGQRVPFAGYRGDADVYPADLGALLGSGSVWQPRPVLQSYSAYTPALIRANAAHLAANPPSRVYFNTDPIDHRYPALEDGASWLFLLGSFTPKALDGGYVVLERSAAPRAALQPSTPVEVDARLGESVAVPGWGEPVWLTLDIQPTLLGKIFSTLFKAPKLSLGVQYEGGGTADYRLVSGMTQTGFLLSPTVSDAKSFIALRSSHRRDLLHGRRIVSFRVYGDSGTRYLWNLRYRVGFSRLEIPVSAEADELLYPEWQKAEPPSSYQIGGDCNIDEVNGHPASDARELPNRLVTVRGWAALDGTRGKPNDGVGLLVNGSDGSSYFIPAIRVPRPDVGAHFNQLGLDYAGYEAHVDARRLTAGAQIRVIQRTPSGKLLCPGPLFTVHKPAAE